ncbi:bifunctional 5,10-methylenetetrahydrofolate dehydrogenase/5,10-methenyltetrahydrofolate cyclohydrolase [bacterium]|nr:bifunctional 5,10-methylenetetrahydrofolate dehydrogenase/5,10-methenyltetrahydrofolate cyclohydrolase [bacterium]
MTKLLDGKALAARVRAEVQEAAAALSPPPSLAVLLIGEDPASQVYVRGKERAAAATGILSVVRREPATISTAEALAIVAGWGADDGVDAILVQMPLPAHIDSLVVLDAIPPEKDADGLHPENLGRLVRGDAVVAPCTPQACMRLLKEAGMDPKGRDALVIGRSLLVGKPMAAMLTAAHATVTLAHSRTRGLEGKVRAADILVAAVGKPGFVPGEWVREGAVVLDVGITRTESGLVGDVGLGAMGRAAALTPVPGGVGPMTIAYLLANTVVLALARRAQRQ